MIEFRPSVGPFEAPVVCQARIDHGEDGIGGGGPTVHH
jgi:hypothetical protein